MTVKISELDTEAAKMLDEAAEYIQSHARGAEGGREWFWFAFGRSWATISPSAGIHAQNAMRAVLGTGTWFANCTVTETAEALRAVACSLRGKNWAYNAAGNPVRKLGPKDRIDGEPGAEDDQPWLDANDEHDYAEERQS